MKKKYIKKGWNNNSAFKKRDKNPSWKGNKVSYKGIHIWIRTNKPMSEICQNCKIKSNKLEATNISGKYKRDIDDYIWLCRSCHLRMDDVANKAWKTKRESN